ncbi:MAG: hypothetical protein IKR16_01390, partial [Firmicutes bacterium]|nr:hypothetical protein [Bacillota bacterium]
VSSEEDRLEAEGELIDRFGDPPAEAENLLDVALIRNIASSMGVQRVVRQQNKVLLEFEERNALKPEAFAAMMDSFGPALTIYGGMSPRISLVMKKNDTACRAALSMLSAISGALSQNAEDGAAS